MEGSEVCFAVVLAVLLSADGAKRLAQIIYTTMCSEVCLVVGSGRGVKTPVKHARYLVSERSVDPDIIYYFKHCIKINCHKFSNLYLTTFSFLPNLLFYF